MYLVSSCLAGIDCRYDGGNCENKKVIELMKEGKVIPVCPEQLGGLPAPRPCCEIVRDKDGLRVINKEGKDVTEEFTLGAEKSLAIAKAAGIHKAILKSRSPSCGRGIIYDGTFTGNKIEGNGFTADLLIQNGIVVYTEEDIDSLD